MKDISPRAEPIKDHFHFRQIAMDMAAIALAVCHEVAKLTHWPAGRRVVAQQSQERVDVGLAELARSKARMMIGQECSLLGVHLTRRTCVSCPSNG